MGRREGREERAMLDADGDAPHDCDFELAN